MVGILPWGPLQDRLHRELLAEPELLPPGSRLLLAVSGGQDSMALLGLLRDLRRLHHWDLQLWHGDHGWRPEAAAQARSLAAWAKQAGLPLQIENASPPPIGEARARHWRYHCLERRARALGCLHVLTGHTATDRAETLLLNLARGTHLAGLTSLRRSRPMGGRAGTAAADLGATPIRLVRPLLNLTREDTGRFCQEQELPLWSDPGNDQLRFSRNRIRHEVMPVLEQLHPGAARRISALAARLEREQDPRTELLPLALSQLRDPDWPEGLRRRELLALSASSQEGVLQHWLERTTGHPMAAQQLLALRRRLPPSRGPGSLDLPRGWRLTWDRSTLVLHAPHGLPAAPLPSQECP